MIAVSPADMGALKARGPCSAIALADAFRRPGRVLSPPGIPALFSGKTILRKQEPEAGGQPLAPIIEAKNLRMRYGEVLAVDGVDLTVESGEIFGLLGPNGAGKTTTIEMLEGLRRPSAGTISIAGLDVVREPRRLKGRIGIQLQSTSLFDLLTVRETIQLFASFAERPVSTERLIATLNLGEKERSLVKTLSGGQQQRLALAIALVNDPAVVFLDEPTTGLDPQARRGLWDFIVELKGVGKTVVISTHYLEEAEILCDRIAIMDHGRIIASGSPRQLIHETIDRSAVEVVLARSNALDVPGLPPRPPIDSVVQDGQVLTVYTEEPPAAVATILHWTEETGQEIADLHIRSASLEDVFLKLTGRSLREQ